MSSDSPTPSATATFGIIANPMSGKDVRRLAARATTTSPETKRGEIARAVTGAAAAGARRVLTIRDAFRIADAATEHIGIAVDVEVLKIDAHGNENDTVQAVEAMRERGAAALLVLGGDGTNRIVSRTWPDAPIMPLSTGTNNVFPVHIEATVAGAALGLVASGQVPLADAAGRCKMVRVEIDGEEDDLAVIDAVFLVDDTIGNKVQFDPARIRRVVLARSEPASVGTSAVGGLVMPAYADDEFGVDVTCCAPGQGRQRLRVPITAGYYGDVHLDGARRLALGETTEIVGPGILAFDGDRERKLAPGQRARLRVERDGPWVIDAPRALARAVQDGCFLDLPHWHDALDDFSGGSSDGCC